MIIDSHAHIFPYLGGASGLDSAETHLKYFQRAIAGSPATPVRRVIGSSIVEEWSLWDENDPGPNGLIKTGFRPGKFGRFEWEGKDGDYYVSLYAPSLQEMEGPAEYMLAEMDYAGIDRCVLQNAWLYGQLNDYFADAIKKYPERFIATAQVKESEGYKENQISELRRAVQELGLKGGLYFANLRLFENDFQDSIDDEKFYPLWEEISFLGIPVFWDISIIPDPKIKHYTLYEKYLNQMKKLEKVLDAFPKIYSILVHGVQLRAFTKRNEFIGYPDEIMNIWKRPNVLLEILFPIQMSYPRPGSASLDYPYNPVFPMIKKLYESLGAEKLIWGSDMPNVLRNCTYKQSLDYLKRYCSFIPENDMDRIIGGNLVDLYDL